MNNASNISYKKNYFLMLNIIFTKQTIEFSGINLQALHLHRN